MDTYLTSSRPSSPATALGRALSLRTPLADGTSPTVLLHYTTHTILSLLPLHHLLRPPLLIVPWFAENYYATHGTGRRHVSPTIAKHGCRSAATERPSVGVTRQARCQDLDVSGSRGEGGVHLRRRTSSSHNGRRIGLGKVDGDSDALSRSYGPLLGGLGVFIPRCLSLDKQAHQRSTDIRPETRIHTYFVTMPGLVMGVSRGWRREWTGVRSCLPRRCCLLLLLRRAPSSTSSHAPHWLLPGS